jgi:tagatose-1,6-bisphosphate aldolase
MSSTGLDAIADQQGRLAILAMDQRTTLRRILTAAGRPAQDSDLAAFKVDVIAALSPYSSAVLNDVDYGLGPVRQAGALATASGC